MPSLESDQIGLNRPGARRRWEARGARGTELFRRRITTTPSSEVSVWLALAVLLILGGAFLAYETRGTTFWADEWAWILTRRGGGLATLLDPHNSHFSLVPVVIYKLLFATFGLRHYWPYRAVLIAVDLACALLVFVYVRARVGRYLALLAAALILLFGPGWQDILWPFQMAWLIAVAAGVGALLLLDRRDRIGDVGACVLVMLSLASAGPGLAVAAGVAVDVLQRRRWRDVWIAAIPIALYALWWVAYQHTALSRHAFLLAPRFVFDSAAGVLSALTGLAQTDVSTDTGNYLAYGSPLVVLAAVGVLWRLRRLERVPPRVLTLLTMVFAFWVLTAIGRAYVAVGSIVLTATGDESRYLYVGAVFLVLLVVELARGYSLSLSLYIGVGVLVVAASVSNIGTLRDGARLLQTQAQLTEAELAALDLSRPVVKPSYISNGFIFGIVTAGAWFSAEKSLGSSAPTPAEIAALPDYARRAADSQLIKIQQLGLRTALAAQSTNLSAPPTIDAVQSGTVSSAGGACISFRPSAYTAAGTSNALQVTVPPRGLLLRAGTVPATVSVRRFSTQFNQIGTLAAGASGTLQITPDLSPRPWHLQLNADGPLLACGRR
ncbi:MAG: hypothetical protein M3025_04720 [Actinomycetota bacterium]|nr:hypothetical protein [Actinomycetota bacterium]